MRHRVLPLDYYKVMTVLANSRRGDYPGGVTKQSHRMFKIPLTHNKVHPAFIRLAKRGYLQKCRNPAGLTGHGVRRVYYRITGKGNAALAATNRAWNDAL